MLFRRILLLGAGLAALTASSAVACPQDSKAAAAPPQRNARAAALVAWKPRAWSPSFGTAVAAGLRVAIDPVDGAYAMPAADETPALRVPDDDAPVAAVRRSDGSIFAPLDDRFADFAVVSLGPDGKSRWTCVHGRDAAAKFMRAPARPELPPPAPGTEWVEK